MIVTDFVSLNIHSHKQLIGIIELCTVSVKGKNMVGLLSSIFIPTFPLEIKICINLYKLIM